MELIKEKCRDDPERDSVFGTGKQSSKNVVWHPREMWIVALVAKMKVLRNWIWV